MRGAVPGHLPPAGGGCPREGRQAFRQRRGAEGGAEAGGRAAAPGGGGAGGGRGGGVSGGGDLSVGMFARGIHLIEKFVVEKKLFMEN